MKISDRKLFRFLYHMKDIFGKETLQPNLKTEMTERKSIFNNFFDQTSIVFDVDSAGKKQASRPFTYCSDFRGLRRFFEEQLEFPLDSKIQIGFDGGKDILKVVWYLDSGTSIFLGTFHSVPETYLNCCHFFDYIDLSCVDFQLSTDLKLANIVLGMTSAASRYPCPYGHCRKDEKKAWLKGTVNEFLKINVFLIHKSPLK